MRSPIDASPEQVLEESAVEEYERQHKVLWDNLVRLHNNISVLEDLVEFPGRAMLGPHGKHFVDWVGVNLYEYTIVVSWRLWGDRDRRSVTLGALRDLVMTRIQPEFKQDQRRRLRDAKPSDEVRDILKRAKAVRHGRIAHIDKDYTFDEARRVEGVKIPEVREVADFLGRYLNALSFGTNLFYDLATFERRDDGTTATTSSLEGIVLGGRTNVLYDQVGAERWWRGPGRRLSRKDTNWLAELRSKKGLPPLEQPE